MSYHDDLRDRFQRPQVECGCQVKMQPDTSSRSSYGFSCPRCGGYCEVRPPEDGWIREGGCGGIRNGMRCIGRVERGRVVCNACAFAAFHALLDSPANKASILRILGDDAIRNEVERQKEEATLKKARQKRERAAESHARRVCEAGHVVYYARLGLNHIKIGTSNNLPRRMKELRVVNVMNLLAAEPGGYDVEHLRHDQFKKWRWNPRTEDFGESDDLLEHIKAVRAEHGDPYGLAATLATSSEEVA